MNDPMSIAGIDDFCHDIKRLMEKHEKALAFIRGIADRSCCNVCMSCAACDAVQFLREIGDE